MAGRLGLGARLVIRPTIHPRSVVRRATAVGAMALALLAGGCGDDGGADPVVWNLRTPVTPTELGGRTPSVVSHRGAPNYTIRFPGRDVSGPFASVTATSPVAGTEAPVDTDAPIDTVDLGLGFAETAADLTAHIDLVTSLFDVTGADADGLADLLARARAGSDAGLIDTGALEPGTSGSRRSVYGVSRADGLDVVLLVGTVDTDAISLTLVVTFDP